MKEEGVDWVRLDVKKPIDRSLAIFEKAHDMGFKVIGVIKSKTMLKGLGMGTEKYLPNSNWGRKWKRHAKTAASTLDQYVEIWQIDNELNHPIHNPIPSVNKQLAVDIVKIGADAVKNANPQAKLAVNLFYKLKGPVPIPKIAIVRDEPLITKYKEELKDKIDILGMDIYRSTWHGGTPEDYPTDLERYHNLWGKDVMIMETGFCTGIFGRSEAHQANHAKEVFQVLDKYFKEVSWFGGIMWYEYSSRHSGLPCEKYFGLHFRDGQKEKPAWAEFVENVNRYKKNGKILGITYHY